MATLVRSNGLGAPVIQAVLGGTIALILAGCLRFMPLHLGVTEPGSCRQ
jgi:ABC-type proline/glycine betaine transport system permease subunit